HFLVDVPPVGCHGRVVTEVLGSGGGDIALGLPVRVGGVIDDDRDQTAGLTRSGVLAATGSFLGRTSRGAGCEHEERSRHQGKHFGRPSFHSTDTRHDRAVLSSLTWRSFDAYGRDRASSPE